MQLKYDLTVGALYIKLSDAKIARTVEAGDNAAVDLTADGTVVGIEVIAVAYPWPLEDILARYAIPAGELAQVRNYFGSQGTSSANQEAPKISIAEPAPTKALAAA